MSRELFVAEPVKTYNALPSIVVDCSLLAAILFNEPSRVEALELLTGKSLHAPNLIDHEIISVAVKKSEAKAGTLVAKGLEGFREDEDRKHNVPFRQIVKIRVALFQTFGWRAGSGWVVVQADTYKLTSCFLSR